MGKIQKSPSTPVAQPVHSRQPAEISEPLQKVSQSTSLFVKSSKGRHLFGAGIPPEISDKAPRDSKKVSKTVSDHKLP
jgi:hypothetical protein